MNIEIFGESHGELIGCVITGFPAGFKIDEEKISAYLARRRGGDAFSTPRAEQDEYKIASGVFNDISTGAPICITIPNKDTKSGDYSKHLIRPNHADFAASVKYKGFNDYRGGGHFSGRLTAAIVAAGAIVCDYLDSHSGIKISSKLISPLDEEILKAKDMLDSIGGKVEVTAINVPAGWGEPFWEGVESVLASLFFSIPAVKAVEFGAGVAFAEMLGSQANDEFYLDDGEIKTRTNNCGGILGGITNGMPIMATLTFKPTPSIGKKQRTVDIEKMEEAELEIRGRHDPCIARRAAVVGEAMMAIGLMKLMNE